MGLGLPYTVWWADERTDPTTGQTNRFNRDFDLLTPAHARTGGQLNANVMPQSAASFSFQDSSAIEPNTSAVSHLEPLYFGTSLNLSAPRYNFEKGQMEFGQISGHSSRSMYDVAEIRDAWLVPRRSYSEAGRYTAHSRRQFASARAGNFTMNIGPAGPDQTGLHLPCDQHYGAIGGLDAVGACTNANFSGGMRVATFTHYAATDIPSNGFGLTYGDAHNTLHLTALHSHPILSTASAANYGIEADDAGNSEWGGSARYSTFDYQWSVNTLSINQTLKDGTSLSAPDCAQEATADTTEDDDYLTENNTIQSITVRDKYGGSAEKLSPLGPTHLGNHAVADTCGLVGFDGYITVTGFFSVTGAGSGQGSASEDLWATEGNGYGGLNVQVHSGLGLRRNRLKAQQLDEDEKTYTTIFRYGTDGAAVQPMTDALKTRGGRFADSTIDGNTTSFFASRTPWDSKGSFGGSGSLDILGGAATSAAPGILGDTVAFNGAWEKTQTLSSAFLKERIPTRVRIVPQIVGYTDVVVAPGTSKNNEPFTSSNQTFRKPIVDYHVIVSVVKPTQNITCAAASNDIGDPTSRNDPDPNQKIIDADYDGEGANLFHAIFRIEPTNMEQVYIQNSFTDTSYNLTLSERAMQNSIMPRHDYSADATRSSKTNQGWGLHQVTPFRPLANNEWVKVPKLAGAIESGGFYQRGGISHLWDAAAYGKELFVGVDFTDSADFAAATTKDGKPWFGPFGHGQNWPDGTMDPIAPPGSELMVFRYSSVGDPYHPGAVVTTPTNNPLYNRMVADRTDATDFIYGAYTSAMDAGFTVTDEAYLNWRGWNIHDWVFPQKEAMRYLGREDKGLMSHHPSLHCSSLRIMDDGRMMMAAVQRDRIVTDDEYPFEDIGYPANPDLAWYNCPPGYYYDSSSKTCKSILGAGDAGYTRDPIIGMAVQEDEPAPNVTSRAYIPTGDNFSRYPTWSKIVANSTARSLILMFSNTKAKDGQVARGRAMFDITWEKVGSQEVATENWTFDDTWWNGSRISYYYPESGQRAIPMTYGSYPECRCSHAVLPTSLPHLMSDLTYLGGFPLSIPLDRVANSPRGVDGTSRASLDAWMTEHRKFLRLTRYVSTTIGFSDFGLGPNPHQEMGWSGWSFPAGLYDPIDYGDGTVFFREDATYKTPWANYLKKSNTYASANRNMIGPGGGWSHFGPLHYGLSSSSHPYRTDRIWTQVHGGVGYDLPLHLLIPPEVHVRARNGGSSGLDLDLELPFHRTDTIELDGAIEFNSGFDLGPEGIPDGTRPALGNFSLNTQLWDSPVVNSGAAKMGGYDSSYQRIHGPIVEGTGLSAFWADHPTDHFHAGAMPILPGLDYDPAFVESNNYPPALLSRTREMSRLDSLAISEQLQSSTEVHVAHGARPFWDSGSIVNAQGVGATNAKGGYYRAKWLSEMDGANVKTVAQACVNYNNGDSGLGKGQRVFRTPDGTLHSFQLNRSAQASSDNYPIWTHFKKPRDSDLFWNSKALKADGSDYDGKDECGPLLASIMGTADRGRVCGAAFTSDSQGTIHAVIEYSATSSNAASWAERSHRLYYTYAKRVVISTNPSPVYDWDWSVHTPVLINATVGDTLAGGPEDLRLPSLVCDGYDRLHLAFQQIYKASQGGGGSDYSAIWMMNKLSTEDDFPTFENSATSPSVFDSRIQLVSKFMSDTTDATMNQQSAGPHAVQFCDHPKICLRGDNVPVVFWRGASPDFVTSSRRKDAIYANRGTESTSKNSPLGRIEFSTDEAFCVVGFAPTDDKNSIPNSDVLYYDAIIDERDRAFVTAIKESNGTYERPTFVTMFYANQTLTEQYSAAFGLGTTRTLFVADAQGGVGNYLSDVTMTTNGKGEIHMVFAFTLVGGVPLGKVYRDSAAPLATQSAIAPLQAPATPVSPLDESTAGDGVAYSGGYDPPTSQDWPDGGTWPSAEVGGQQGKNKHFLEVWMPSFEWDQASSADHWVIRSINIRWLSTPSMNYNATDGWFPAGASAGISGAEDFPHFAPQLRYQRFWGYDSGALDLKWNTNELSWRGTPLPQGRLMMPGSGRLALFPADANDPLSDPSAADEIPGY